MSLANRRIWVLINHLCLALLLISFYFGKETGMTAVAIGGLALAVIVGIISFILVHISSGLWKLTHSKTDKLDERQILITHEALRLSYGIFAITSLVVLLALALLEGKYNITLIVIFAALLYLAHTLPSSILAWAEKEV